MPADPTPAPEAIERPGPTRDPLEGEVVLLEDMPAYLDRLHAERDQASAESRALRNAAEEAYREANRSHELRAHAEEAARVAKVEAARLREENEWRSEVLSMVFDEMKALDLTGYDGKSTPPMFYNDWLRAIVRSDRDTIARLTAERDAAVAEAAAIKAAAEPVLREYDDGGSLIDGDEYGSDRALMEALRAALAAHPAPAARETEGGGDG